MRELHLALFTMRDGSQVEVSATGYSRQLITFAAPTPPAGNAFNNRMVRFPTARGDWGRITHAAVMDGDHQIQIRDLHAHRKVERGDVLEFRPGSIALSPDAQQLVNVPALPDPLAGLAGLETNTDPNHPLTAALRNLVRGAGLHGAVLISFSGDRVGINSSAPSPVFARAMEDLANNILARIDDGDFDPEVPA